MDDLIFYAGAVWIYLYYLSTILEDRDNKDTEPDDCCDDPFTVPKQKTTNGINKSSD